MCIMIVPQMKAARIIDGMQWARNTAVITVGACGVAGDTS